jgi:hypothetical protein
MAPTEVLMRYWIQTYSGVAFDLENPIPEMVRVKDIAQALSQINRYTGHTKWPYSVAQHSVLCAQQGDLISERIGFLALIHDAQEAYVGDCSSPLKALLPNYEIYEEAAERAICTKLGVNPTKVERKKVHEIDLRMLATEAKQLLKKGPSLWSVDAEPYEFEIRKWSPRRAMMSWLEMLDRYL